LAEDLLEAPHERRDDEPAAEQEAEEDADPGVAEVVEDGADDADVEAYQQEHRAGVAERLHRVLAQLLEPVGHAERHPLDAAEDEVGPGGAVPDPADEHREEDVQVLPEGTFSAAAERDVDVIAQPGRQ